MIVSETSNRASSRWLPVCVLLCAIVVLSLGVTHAQDYKAVAKRLDTAVAAGELTAEQAKTMLGSLKKAGGKDQAADKAKSYLMQVKKKLGALIEAGKISEEDAAKKYQAAEKAVKMKMAGAGSQCGSKCITPKSKELSRIEDEIRKAMDAGKLSKEEAQAKMKAVMERAGEQSKEAAKKQSKEAAKKQSKGAAKKIAPKDLSRIEDEIRKAMNAGKLSKEEAQAKMKAVMKMAGEQSQRDGDTRPTWEGIKKRIEGAVQRGDMTRDQADAKYKELKNRGEQ